jgi:hypothetical protein
MKKPFLAFLFCALCMSSWAQSSKWKIGLRFDPNITWYKPEKDIVNTGAKMRFGFGLAIDKMFTDNYAIGTGFNVVRLGGGLKYLQETNGKDAGILNQDLADSTFLIDKSRAYELQFFEVPLTLKLRTNEIGYITYWAQMGIGLGVRIKATADDQNDVLKQKKGDTFVDDNTTRDGEVTDINIKDNINALRLGFIVAGGIEYNLSGSTSLVAGVGYNNGLNNILKGKAVADGGTGEPLVANGSAEKFDLKAVSRVFSFTFGILF